LQIEKGSLWTGTIQGEKHRSGQVFVNRILWVFLFLVWGGLFSSICAAAPLMVEKNLFATDRKPPPEFADASAKAFILGIAIGNIQLDGVIIQGNSKKAVLRMKGHPAGAAGQKGQPASPFMTVREGQMVSDYRLSKIESKSILLEKDGQTFTVGLFAEDKEVTQSPSLPPAPAHAQQPMAAPGVAPQVMGANRPADVQLQPGSNPANPQQLPPGEMPPPFDPNVASSPASQINIAPNEYAPAINQDPNQPAMTIEEAK
jgi:hypothetical protein